MKINIPLSDLDFGDEETCKVSEVIASKWLSMGPVTTKFEDNFKNYIGSKNAFAVSSGTAALHLACSSIGLKEGDEVIVPSLTFVASANCVIYTGAKPVFADITSLENLNISTDSIAEKITDKTKAIVAVHYGGYPCDMDQINKIARENDLYVIEDCAHSPGAMYNGKKTGTLGDIGCFSFFSNKNMTTGEGGMVTTDNLEFSEKIKLMRSHGMTSLSWDRHRGHAKKYEVVTLGYNYRTNEMSSALGIVQLEKLDEINRRRKKIVGMYNDTLQNIQEITIPFLKYDGESSYHLYPIILSETISREGLINNLMDNGIQTSIHYQPIHLFDYYKSKFHTKSGMLPKTEYVGEHLITLPLHPLMSESDVEYICDNIIKYIC